MITGGGPTVNRKTSTPGQNVRLTFNGSAVSRGCRGISSPLACSYAQSYIHHPDGTTLGTTVFSGSDYIDTRTLPASGNYTILIDPVGSTTGSVTLTDRKSAA